MKLIYIATLCLMSTSLFAQDFWVQEEMDFSPPITETTIMSYNTFSFSMEKLKTHLAKAPDFNANYRADEETKLSLPFPDGTTVSFIVEHSPMMSPVLSAKFPQIKTYQVTQVDDRSVFGRLSITDKGFHGMILGTKGGALFIDPASTDNLETSVVYYKKDFQSTKYANHSCGVTEEFRHDHDHNSGGTRAGSISLYKYRLALAGTAEYCLFHSSAQSTSAVLSAMTVSVNRVNTVFQRDMAILLELVANNDNLIFFNTNTDGYTNNNSLSLLSQNQSKCNSVIGAANYDIGHVFSTASGGLANPGVVCANSFKARGTTGISQPIGDPFDIDFVTHEIGHQFSANHSFNSCANDGNENYDTGKEPGSGSTILGYAGLCGANNVQTFSDPYFHAVSLSEMNSFTRTSNGSVCKEIVSNTTQTKPDVAVIASGFKIPKSTPFELSATATDVDGDDLTYTWDQYDDISFGTSLGSPSGNSPLFRSIEPTTDNTRVFPKMSTILNNGSDVREVLPTYARDISFKFVARDNHSTGGGYTFGDVSFSVDPTAGPFTVNFPNLFTDEVLDNESAEVTWDVANTDNVTGVNCQNVNIYLSLSPNVSFDILLAENVPNTGSAMVPFPDVTGNGVSTARLKIKAADNIFFDISNSFFTIKNNSEASITNIGDSEELNVFPNPFTDRVTIESKNIMEAMDVRIFSSNGQMVHQSVWDGQQQYSISTTQLGGGYFLC